MVDKNPELKGGFWMYRLWGTETNGRGPADTLRETEKKAS